MQKVLLIGFLALAGTLSAAPSATACDCQGGYGFGFGYDIGNLYRTLDDNVPYFAAHPPVYYSMPVPRTYGYSPFAYPPGVMTPEVVLEPAPQEILNPYVPEPSAEAAPASATVAAPAAPQPLVVLNPYVDGPSVALAD